MSNLGYNWITWSKYISCYLLWRIVLFDLLRSWYKLTFLSLLSQCFNKDCSCILLRMVICKSVCEFGWSSIIITFIICESSEGFGFLRFSSLYSKSCTLPYVISSRVYWLDFMLLFSCLCDHLHSLFSFNFLFSFSFSLLTSFYTFSFTFLFSILSSFSVINLFLFPMSSPFRVICYISSSSISFSLLSCLIPWE
jgi:hypothetical protein